MPSDRSHHAPPYCLVVALIILTAPAARALAACTLGCSAYVPSKVAVGQSLDFSATAIPSGCSGAAAFDWDFGDGTPHAAERSPSHAYAAPGTYVWTVVITQDGKTCSRTGTITVCVIECVAAVPENGRVAAPVRFEGSDSATTCGQLSFDWNFGDGSAHSFSADRSHTYTAVGVYDWTLTVRSGSISCTKSGTITIAEAVACSECAADVPATAEAGAAVPFRVALGPADCSGTAAYAWAFGDGATSTLQSPDHRYCAAGAYPWTVTVTMGGVTCTRSGVIVVDQPTALECTASLVQVTAGCPSTGVFIGSTPGCTDRAAYEWSFGDGSSSTGSVSNHVYTTRGVHNWSMTATLAGGTCTRSGTITVTKPTTIVAVGTPSPTSGAPPLEVAFLGSAQPESCISSATYSWDFGDGTTSGEQNPSHTYGATGFYTWALTATAEGVSSTARGPIIVSTLTPSFTWAPQLGGTTAPVVDVHFTDESEGWMVAQRGLLHSTDGAGSWAVPQTPWGYAVRFLDRDAGFFAAECGLSRTLDRGASWGGIYFASCGGFSFTDMFPVSSSVAWLCDSSGGMWRFTFLGGSAFEITRAYSAGTGSGNFRGLWFTDADTGWAVGDLGRIVSVSDASGSSPTYTSQVSGTSSRLSGIFMLDGDNGWAVGEDGTIIHTMDGGTSWGPQASGTSLRLNAIDFKDGSMGFAVGEGGSILATTDGGESWSPEPDPLASELRSVSTPPGRFSYAVGARGTVVKRLPYTCPAITMSPEALSSVLVGVPSSQQITASGGSPPYTYGVAAGGLPQGLLLDPSGLLAGIASAASRSSFTLRAVDAEYCSGDRAYSLDAEECTLTCAAPVQASARVGSPVFFEASWTVTGCTEEISHRWDFGDGSPPATGQTATHAYATAGTRTWTLTTSAGGQTCTATGTIAVIFTPRRVLPRATGAAAGTDARSLSTTGETPGDPP
jgi:PKD repeat protein